MTASRHVLVNTSHRFWIFPLKQKQNQTSPNYILVLICFKHVLTSQEPGNSSFSVPVCSCFPQWTHPSPREADTGSPVEPLRLLEKLRASSLHRRAEGSRRPEPRATSFPGIGAHLLGAVQAQGQGKHEWDDSRRHECFLSTTTHLLLSAWGGLTVLLFVGAHQEILSKHKKESTRRNHLKSKPATHPILKFKDFTKHMVSFA